MEAAPLSSVMTTPGNAFVKEVPAGKASGSTVKRLACPGVTRSAERARKADRNAKQARADEAPNGKRGLGARDCVFMRLGVGMGEWEAPASWRLVPASCRELLGATVDGEGRSPGEMTGLAGGTPALPVHHCADEPTNRRTDEPTNRRTWKFQKHALLSNVFRCRRQGEKASLMKAEFLPQGEKSNCRWKQMIKESYRWMPHPEDCDLKFYPAC